MDEPLFKKLKTEDSHEDKMNEPLLKKLKTEESHEDRISTHDNNKFVDNQDGNNNSHQTFLNEQNETNIKKSKKSINIYDRKNEEKVGMLHFVNQPCQFSGIIKQRFADFMVRECDLEGNLVYLKSLEHCDNGIFEDSSNQNTVVPVDVDVEQIKNFVLSEDKSKTLILKKDDDKEHRKLVHKYIKDTYKDIETGTEMLPDGSRAIILSFKCAKQQKSRKNNTWPKNLPKFCHFTLFKQNKDTMECISLLAKLLHVNASCFSYAGTKDRRATTVQQISAQNIYSKNLLGVNKRLNNIVLGDFVYRNEQLKLGDLTGNEFTIIIRNVQADDASVNQACNLLKENGFVNYFGLQRFGTGGVATHEIGKALLKNNFSEAVDMVLMPRLNSNDYNAESNAKKIWTETKDAAKAFEALLSCYSIEGKLLAALNQQKHGYNFWNAWQTLPRNNRLLYLHSYQSFIWNHVVSKRINMYGLSPVVGDLVLTGKKDQNGYDTSYELTDKDIESLTYSIYDVVLPLPGYDMRYPSNGIRQVYEEMLVADGLDINNMRNKIKELSLSGKLRNIIAKPTNMEWRVSL
uniref:Pseudouridylate synthase 7 homolog n=1 Tax=Hydra vulgaris TaxID=6087 RepID=T2M708_HYDVU